MWLAGNSALIASAAMNLFMVMKGVTMSLFIQRAITFLHVYFDFSSLQLVNSHMPLHMLRYMAHPLAKCDAKIETLAFIAFS
jgi:hypothetical protein